MFEPKITRKNMKVKNERPICTPKNNCAKGCLECKTLTEYIEARIHLYLLTINQMVQSLEIASREKMLADIK